MRSRCAGFCADFTFTTHVSRRIFQLFNSYRVWLWENTRKEFREQFESRQLKASILPTGSVEKHNEQMAMVADVAIATLVSQKASLELYRQ